ETDEVAARVYVERVRAVADGWLESTGLAVRLSVGGATPRRGGTVAGAAVTAEQRMHDAVRGTRPTPTIVPPTATGPGPLRSPRRSGGLRRSGRWPRPDPHAARDPTCGPGRPHAGHSSPSRAPRVGS